MPNNYFSLDTPFRNIANCLVSYVMFRFRLHSIYLLSLPYITHSPVFCLCHFLYFSHFTQPISLFHIIQPQVKLTFISLPAPCTLFSHHQSLGVVVPLLLQSKYPDSIAPLELYQL
ncbi:hypothetical protein L211DRAFT_880896 [Terfezia boudieri ATCC MYA-4762]|uniref:Uncharacterized protein n=1 Tax=Terfezia boudieri ATCC MYA-4762 TaxID=1051890 RepID=A0A3N4LQX9_9PEZI|nr:hypothetical protein L211DRAFT_880896 [Terfezia boudieri ATCC MYA-4762]